MRRILLLAAFVVMIFLFSGISEKENDSNYIDNRFPLLNKPYIELPLGAIKADGWLKDQLIRMKNGMTGHLDSLYEPVMGKRNGWLGGDGDVWERGPYWIDGLLPLAYILDDKALQEKVKPWIEWSIKSQKPNGYFGPDTDRVNEPGLQRNNSHDWWPKMVMLKVMQQYYTATSDQRIISFLTNYFRYQYNELPKTPLNKWTDWGQYRGGDNLAIVYWLYNITGDKFLLQLAEIIHQQTFNWTETFEKHEKLFELYGLHGVNLGQGIKEPVIYYQQSKDARHLNAVLQGFADIRKSIGWPNGMFAADEMIHSNSPTQGSELCTAVELMFSLENMLAITARVQFADHLERIAFNALPTQITDNFDARQYYQQLNQVEVSLKERNFMTAYHGTDQLFGILTGYPCCTSNLHQGWPKFTQNLWYATEDKGLAALIYAPSQVKVKVANGIEVQFTEDTYYPFSESILFKYSSNNKIDNISFPFHLRIPAWCNQAIIKVNGKLWSKEDGNQIVKLSRAWQNGDQLELTLPMTVNCDRWSEGSVAIERGPLLYALKIGEEWKKTIRDKNASKQYGNFYYEVFPTSSWNYCIPLHSLDSVRNEFKIVKKEFSKAYPWNPENAPLEIITKGKRIAHWTLYNGSSGPLPYSIQEQLAAGNEEEITLIPYGCTTLRITEFPVSK
jgi:DUF1680 family protein